MSAARGDAPARIGRFEIRGEIGRGTMGVVYEAQDPVLGRMVALKTIAVAAAGGPADRTAFEQRFLAEARIAARLSHPGIVVIHDAGRDASSGTLYMALERLSGRTLEEIVSEGRPVEWREALRVLGRVAEALHHAHAQGVVHRDVKPANVMLLQSGEPKIMDFGIAKLVIEGHATTTGQLLGTPLYMAPEQAQADAVDARTDIFSLGAIAYSLLTGTRAFQARSIPGILSRVLHHDPEPPSALVAGLPPAVDDLVARAMAKAPAARYPTAKAMAEDIEDILADRTPRHRAGWTPPPVGARTMVSPVPDDLGELELLEEPRAAAGRVRRARSDPRPRFLAMVLLGGGIGIAAAGLLRFEILAPEERSPAPPSLAPSPSAPASSPEVPTLPIAEAAEPGASPTPPADTAVPTDSSSPGETAARPQPEVAEASPAPTPEPSDGLPSPSPEPSAPIGSPAAPSSPAAPLAPVPSPVATPAPKPKEPDKRPPDSKARLAVHLDPGLPATSLRVWIDGKLVADEKLDPTVARKTQTLRADLPLRTLSLSPGRRQVRVQVRTEDGTRSERLLVSVKAGSARRLDVKAGRSASALSFVLR